MRANIVVIGANAAGMTAASRARRLDPNLEIVLFEQSDQIAYSICGLPYWLSRQVPRFEDLILFTPEALMNERGLRARTKCRVTEIQPRQHRVLVDPGDGAPFESIAYDQLLISTGYRPKTLSVEGAGASGVFTASHIQDGRAIEDWLLQRRPRRAAVVGGGYVGVEMAEALHKRGLSVVLVEASGSLLPQLDPDMSELVRGELERCGVRVELNRHLGAIETKTAGERAVEAIRFDPGGLRTQVEIVFVDVGIEPRVDLAASAGLRLGATGAIEVNEYLQTSVSGVYAAGNCAETIHLVTGKPTRSGLGTVAAKQGRVAGENMAGLRTRFVGLVGTSIVQVFDLSVASTGLNVREAVGAGYDPVDAKIEANFQAAYFDDGARGTVKLVADQRSERLLGAQIIGSREAALRIDVAATAIQAGLSVSQASQLDLAYAPPLGTLWNPFLVALNQLKREL